MIFKKERDTAWITATIILLCVFSMKKGRNIQKEITQVSKTGQQKVNIVQINSNILQEMENEI